MKIRECFTRVGAGEELVAAACAAVAEWVPDAKDELHGLSEAHLRVAVRFKVKPKRWLRLRMTLKATLAAAVGTDLGALKWLRKQEQQLVDLYVALEGAGGLDDEQRQQLRQHIVPSAFERFSRVDRLIMAREEQQGLFA